jgi:ferredoxin
MSVPAPPLNTAVKVTFNPNNVAVAAQAGEPIVAVAERAGVRIRLGCRAGACGACQVKVGDCFIRACISAVPTDTAELAISV